MFDKIAKKISTYDKLLSFTLALCMISLVLLSVYDLRPANAAAGSSSNIVNSAVAGAISGKSGGAVAGAIAGGGAGGAAAATGTAVATLVNNEPTVISKNVINTIIKTNSAKATSTTSTSSSSPLVDRTTLKLEKVSLPSNLLLPLVDIEPFRIIGGEVSLNSPNKNIKLVAATISDKGVEHAVVLDLKKVLDNTNTKDALYSTDLGEVISGTNLFTKKHDVVSDFTDLLLWNNSNSPITFGDSSAVAMTVVFK
jgi:hypothetical protein